MNRAMRWPLGIAAILALTVGANIALYYVAGRDPSFVIEPDYYAKAITWDSTLAQGRRNQALGWRLAPTLTAFSSHDGARLTVSLTDSAGHSITDATVKVSAVFNARAAQVLESTLLPDRDGYAARLAVNHRGQWEFRFDVRRGAEHFTTSKRVEATPAGPGA